MQGAGGASHLSLQRPAPSFTWHEASWQSPELDSACFLMSVPGSDQITVFILSHSLAAPQHHQGRHRSHLPALSSSITATSRFIMTAGVAALTSASQDGSKEHQGGTCGNSSWKTQPFPGDFCGCPHTSTGSPQATTCKRGWHMLSFRGMMLPEHPGGRGGQVWG